MYACVLCIYKMYVVSLCYVCVSMCVCIQTCNSSQMQKKKPHTHTQSPTPRVNTHLWITFYKIFAPKTLYIYPCTHHRQCMQFYTCSELSEIVHMYAKKTKSSNIPWEQASIHKHLSENFSTPNTPNISLNTFQYPPYNMHALLYTFKALINSA